MDQTLAETTPYQQALKVTLHALTMVGNENSLSTRPGRDVDCLTGAGMRGYFLISTLLLLSAAPARATITIDGDDAFKTSVNGCIDKFLEADPETKDIINKLKTPPAKHDHKIKKSDKSNNTDYDTQNDADSAAAGGTGAGTGTTTGWDPGYTDPYGDGTARDPCASLLHELRHALDGEQGTRDSRLDGATSIKTNEIEASKEENRYRKKKGLPQRGKYGDKDLPASAKL
jgi:hypothetical protein